MELTAVVVEINKQRRRNDRATNVAPAVPVQVNASGSLSTVFVATQPVHKYQVSKRSDTERYVEFCRQMLDRGIFLAPSQFEAAFVSAAHTDADIDRTLVAARESFQALSAQD